MAAGSTFAARSDAALDALAAVLPPGSLLRDPAALLVYARDASQERGRPMAVVLPRSTAEVQAIARWSATHGRPLVARGAGTGLAGGAVGAEALIVSLARMRELHIDPISRLAVVGPGLTRDLVDEAAAQHGLAYPPDPSSGVASTIGGNVACNAGGPHCLSRGVTQRWVAGLEVVLADGRCVRLRDTGVAAHPNRPNDPDVQRLVPHIDAPGPDWTALLVGSEGTLALITEITLRLAPRRPAKRALLAAFPDVARAGAAVTAVLAAGLRPAAVELMDQRIMRIIEDWIAPGLPVEAGAALLVEVDGRASTLETRLAAIAEVLSAQGATELRQARDEAQTAALWRGRKSAGGAMSRLAPAYYSVDVTVPRGALAAALGEVEDILAEADLPAGYVAHVGDGNLHPLLPLDPADPADRARVEGVARRIAEAALRRGGSITGEHGVGREKRGLLRLQLDAATRSAMQDLRRGLDPRDMLNPGAVFDAQDVPQSAPSIHPAPDRPTAAIRVAAADFVLHAPAETPVAEAIAAAARAGRRLPLVAPWPGTTLRALFDGNLAPPSRHADGAPRDLLLAATITLPDGRTIHSGRGVHKNVAGYDLHRLLVGAGGRLGRFDALSLALAPPDGSQRSLIVPAQDLATAIAIAERLAAGAMDARSVVVARVPTAPSHPTHPIHPTPAQPEPWCAVLTAAGEQAEVEAEIVAARLHVQAGAAGAPAGGPPWESHAEAHTGAALWAQALGRAARREGAVRQSIRRMDLPPGRWAAALASPNGRRLLPAVRFVDVYNGTLWFTTADDTLDVDIAAIVASFGEVRGRPSSWAAGGGETDANAPLGGAALCAMLERAWHPQSKRPPRSTEKPNTSSRA
jgi:D-lactate dehydrogenase (cytochrome)